MAKRYGSPGEGVLTVDAIDFQVRAGEVFGPRGPNGAGKTTTIHMLTCLMTQPDAGEPRCGGWIWHASRNGTATVAFLALSFDYA